MYALCDASALQNTSAQADRAHRDTSSQRFGEAEDIRLNIVLFTGEEATDTAKARLHFIDNQQGSPLPTERRELLYIGLVRDVDAALALDEFDDDGGGLFGDCRACRIDIVIADMRHAGQKWRKGLAIVRLPGRGERAHAASVEATQGRDDAAPPGSQASEFEGALDSFSAAVAEEEARDPLRCNLHQAF